MSHSKTRRGSLPLALLIGAIALGGCGQSSVPANTLPDGTYTGESEPESDGSYGIINFTVQSGNITDASFVMYDQDGTAHDQNYGLGADGTPVDKDFYQRAQNAIEAEKQFVTQFKETGDQSEVESIAGASLSLRLFHSAIDDAINGAE